MTIRVYPSKIEGEPIERHETDEEITIGAWLFDNVKNYFERDSHPISIEVNGLLVRSSRWADFLIVPDDDVCIYVEPKGAELIIAAVTIAAAATLITSLLVPKLPSQDKNGQGKGQGLDDSAIKGNQIRINAPIREVSGTRKIYPDYILPLHRYFASPRELWSEFLLSVGVGEFDIPAEKILIGDTPIGQLGDDAEVVFYGPGESLAGDTAAIWWHSAPEVGATNAGNAGLELAGQSSVTLNVEASAFNFSGNQVTIPAGAGTFPADWESDMIVRIEVEYPYTIADGTGAGGRDRITGAITQLGLPNGSNIEITGDNSGLYTVFGQTATTMDLNYANGSPATSLQTGSVSMGISYVGHLYKIVTVTTTTLTLQRLTDTGAVDGSWPGFGALNTNSASISIDTSFIEGFFTGPYVACPDGETTTVIEWDIMFPGGLFQVNKYNNPVSYPVTVILEYRDKAIGGAWTSVSRTYTTASIDAIGFTETETLPYAMQPEVRVRRQGADSAEATISDTVQWYGLRSRLNAPTSYADVTTMALRVRSGNRLSAQTENLISIEATRILPILDGGLWLPAAPTRDISAWVGYVVQDVGYTLGDIDISELDRLNDIWQSRGDFFDESVETTTTVKSLLGDSLAAGFSELTIDRGLIRPVRDEPRTVYEHMYTPQNMLEPMVRSFKALNVDDFDGVDVEYMDETSWQIETVECRLPGDIGRRVEKMKVNGVTNRDRAWRMGMRQRRAQKYRRKTFNFHTEMDAFNSRYLSYCAIADDVPGYGQSAILESIAPMGSAHLLVSSEPFDWSAGGTHMVAIRKPDGILSGPYVATRIDDFRLTIPSIDFTPDTSWEIEPPHLLFGPVNRWSYPVLISDISPSGNVGADVTATNYDVRVYADDDNEAPD